MASLCVVLNSHCIEEESISESKEEEYEGRENNREKGNDDNLNVIRNDRRNEYLCTFDNHQSLQTKTGYNSMQSHHRYEILK